MIHTVTIGPLDFLFGNVNEAMGLRGYHHQAHLWLADGTRGPQQVLALGSALMQPMKVLLSEPLTV